MCRKRLLLAIAIVFCTLPLFSCTEPDRAPQLVHQLKADIPLNVTPDYVLKYLDKHRIEHWKYIRSPTEGNWIGAIVRGTSINLFIRTDYKIIFKFNEKDLLIAFDIRKVYTGP
jgi:hypothetical protein